MYPIVWFLFRLFGIQYQCYCRKKTNIRHYIRRQQNPHQRKCGTTACFHLVVTSRMINWYRPAGSAFIKPDQLDPWIKDLIKITLLSTVSHLQLPNFVTCGRACPSHMTQNLVTVGAKLWTAKPFLVDPWSAVMLGPTVGFSRKPVYAGACCHPPGGTTLLPCCC